MTPVATNLNNPRGIDFLPDGRMVVLEAGTGTTLQIETTGTGRISIFEDVNGDGDYDDAGERTPILDGVPSYNSLRFLNTGHDEVYGLGDLVTLPDGSIYFTKDDPFAEPAPQFDDLFYGDTGIFSVNAASGEAQRLVKRAATVSAIAYHPEREGFYATESGLNAMMFTDLAGEVTELVTFAELASGQQAVPAGIAYDPTTGDLLVALFSGFIKDYYGTMLSFMPGDAKIVRYDPDTEMVTDEITGLTTAIDVAVDDSGNVYVAELTTEWAPALMPAAFDLYDPASPPDVGGYERFSGRITAYPAGGGEPMLLADGVETPTNMTWHAGALYISTGLGTPGRSVHTAGGLHAITGVIYRMNGI
ncbi:MAG: ScyD/ScyE family protein [Chloroflexota bacterium]